MDEALARQLIGLPGWRWMPGMLARDCGTGRSMVRVAGNRQPRSMLPDLDDDATGGRLLGMLPPNKTVQQGPQGWWVGGTLPRDTLPEGVAWSSGVDDWHATLAHACAAALVALGRAG